MRTLELGALGQLNCQIACSDGCGKHGNLVVMYGWWSGGSLRLWDHDKQEGGTCPPQAFDASALHESPRLPPLGRVFLRPGSTGERKAMLERWMGVRLIDNGVGFESTLVGLSVAGDVILSCLSVVCKLAACELICGRNLRGDETGYALDSDHSRLRELKIDVIGHPATESEEDDTIKWARKLHAERGYSVGKSATHLLDQSGGLCGSHW